MFTGIGFSCVCAYVWMSKIDFWCRIFLKPFWSFFREGFFFLITVCQFHQSSHQVPMILLCLPKVRGTQLNAWFYVNAENFIQNFMFAWQAFTDWAIFLSPVNTVLFIHHEKTGNNVSIKLRNKYSSNFFVVFYGDLVYLKARHILFHEMKMDFIASFLFLKCSLYALKE